jgi:hypothetical protein
MRLIGTAVALAAALVLATAGVADAKKGKRGGGAKTYKFTVECPVASPVPWTKGTCSAKGKTQAAARATCESQNNFCYVRNVSKAKAKGKKRK